MKNNRPADRVCGIKISSLLPLIEEESKWGEITDFLRRMVNISHPNILREIPDTVSLHLTPKYTGKVTKTTPEALLLVGNYFAMVVFVTNFNKGGKVIGTVWAYNKLVEELFEDSDVSMIKEALSTSSRPDRDTWETYCMDNSYDHKLLNVLLEEMESESEEWCNQRRL